MQVVASTSSVESAVAICHPEWQSGRKKDKSEPVRGTEIHKDNWNPEGQTEPVSVSYISSLNAVSDHRRGWCPISQNYTCTWT